MSDNRVQISIEAYNRAKDAFNDLQRDIKGVERETAQASQKSGISLQQLRQNWLAVTAVVAAAAVAVRRAWQQMDAAATYLEQVRAVDALATQYEISGVRMVNSVRETARGLVSMADAADMAARGLNLSLDPEQILRFTAVAETLTDVIGGDVPTAYHRMIEAAATGRTLTLQQMGIIVSLSDAHEEYARKLGTTADKLTEAQKQQSALNAILVTAEHNMAALGPTVDTAKDKMDRLMIVVEDLELQMGVGLLRAAAGMTATLYGMAGAALVVAGALAGVAVEVDRLTGKESGFFAGLRGAWELFRELRQNKLQTEEQWVRDLLGEEAPPEPPPLPPEEIEALFKKPVDYKTLRDDLFGAAQDLFGKATDNLAAMMASVEDLTAAQGRRRGKTSAERLPADPDAALKKEQDMLRARAALQRQLTEWTAAEQEKRLLLIEEEAAAARKMAAKAWDVNDPEGEAAYQEALVEIHRAATDQKRQITADFHRFQREAEIESQIASLDLAEAEGAARRETLDERIRLTRELLAIQANYLAQLDKTQDTTAWYQQARAIEQTRKELAELIQDRALVDPLTAMRRAMRDVHNDWSDTGKQMYNMARDTAQAMNAAFSDFFFDAMRGELTSLGDYVDAFLRSVQRSIANTLGQQMSAGITSGITSLARRFIGGDATAAVAPDSAAAVTGMSGYGGYPEMHGGGWVGVDTPSRYRIVPHSIFADAPRYHRGLAPDEKAAILQDGELVIPADRARRAYTRTAADIQTIKVEINNASNAPLQAEKAQVRVNGQEMIVSLWLDALNRNAYGLRDAIGGG